MTLRNILNLNFKNIKLFDSTETYYHRLYVWNRPQMLTTYNLFLHNDKHHGDSQKKNLFFYHIKTEVTSLHYDKLHLLSKKMRMIMMMTMLTTKFLPTQQCLLYWWIKMKTTKSLPSSFSPAWVWVHHTPTKTWYVSSLWC